MQATRIVAATATTTTYFSMSAIPNSKAVNRVGILDMSYIMRDSLVTILKSQSGNQASSPFFSSSLYPTASSSSW
jgi:hypothetical protein